jgi:hypothetical protein
MTSFKKLIHFFDLHLKKHIKTGLLGSMKARHFLGHFMTIMCQITLIVVVVFVTLRICDVYRAYRGPNIGVVNITGIVNEFVKNKGRSNLSQAELKRQVHLFGESLEKVLRAVGAKNRLVLMPAEAVITEAKDYTQEVQQELSQAILLGSNFNSQETQRQVTQSQIADKIENKPQGQERQILSQEISSKEILNEVQLGLSQERRTTIQQ